MPSEYCDYTMKLEINEGSFGPGFTTTLSVVLDLIAAASSQSERYRRVRERREARDYSFHLSCYPPAFESFVESVRPSPSYCDPGAVSVSDPAPMLSRSSMPINLCFWTSGSIFKGLVSQTTLWRNTQINLPFAMPVIGIIAKICRKARTTWPKLSPSHPSTIFKHRQVQRDH